MFFGEKILEYWDDIVKDLAAVVAIPSVCGAPEGAYPFGKEPARAIDTAMALAESYGLKTKNVGYYACHAEIGQGEENAVVMAHLDVVPAGEGWNSDPFELMIRDGFAFGRGVADNKGPAIVALHCLRALKDLPGKRKLRVVMGSGEEIGMEDMDHYFAAEQAPTLGFTPDAAYGICNCEKGIMRFTLRGKNDSSVIRTFSAGTVVNAVPYKAEADILCSEEEFHVLAEAAYKLEGAFVITRTSDGAHILAKGLAAHASMPEKGKNAAAYLIDLLHSVFGSRVGVLLRFAKEKIGVTCDGSAMGVACSDEPSGSLTFNLGIVTVGADTASLQVDIRYPATCAGEGIVTAIQTQAEAAGLEFAGCSGQKPLYQPADGPLVTLLSNAYETVTGEKCGVFSMGGGTYARQMGGNGVAFGASFPNDECFEHNCNERIHLEQLKLHAQICLEAMYRMYTCDWEA